MKLQKKYANLRFIVQHTKELDGRILSLLIKKYMKEVQVNILETLVMKDMHAVHKQAVFNPETYTVVICEYDTEVGTIIDDAGRHHVKSLSALHNVAVHVVTTWPGLSKVREALGSTVASVSDRSELDTVLQNIIDSMK
jgi:hypothetical protein